MQKSLHCGDENNWSARSDPYRLSILAIQIIIISMQNSSLLVDCQKHIRYWINPCYTSFKTILPTDPQLKCPDSFKQAPTSQLILSNTASTDTFSKACRERERWKRERLDLKWFKNSVLGLEPIPMLRVCLGQRISFSHPWKLLCCVEDLFKQVISTGGGGVHQKERQEDPRCRILHLR